MPGPNWTLSDDRKTLTVTFSSIPPVALRYDAQQVDEFIKNLGEMRAAMLPSVGPPDHQLGQAVGAIPNPRWSTEPELMMGNSLLHLLDLRFGWLHYVLPRDEAKKLAQLLQSQAEAPPPGQEQGTPN